MQAWEIITLQFVLCHGSRLFWFESPHHPGRYLGMIPGLPGRRLQLGSVEISGKMSLFGIRIPQALDGTNNYKANGKTSNFPVLIFACPHAENSSYYSCRLSQPPREICNIMAKWGTASSSDSFKVTQRRIHSFNLDGTMTEWTHTQPNWTVASQTTPTNILRAGRRWRGREKRQWKRREKENQLRGHYGDNQTIDYRDFIFVFSIDI